jgi:membrane protease YdiL (CAAX protease family)
MTATLLTKVSIAAIALVLIALFTGKRIAKFKAYIGIFFIAFFADNLLIIMPNAYPALQVIPNHTWEGFLVCSWSGKLYSILFILALLYFTRQLLARDEVGLTFHQNPGFLIPAVLVITILAAWATRVGFNSLKGTYDPLTLLYLALMPGINEELVYRGVLQGILNKILPLKINLLGAWVGWGAAIVSVLFSLLHGFSFDHALRLHLEWIALGNSLFTGLSFAWLRERTGSLLMPIAAHGAVDFLFFLPRMI